MPAVGMRRTTRVFGVRTAADSDDSARILRSGRRLCQDSNEPKAKRSSKADEWTKKPENNNNNASDVATPRGGATAAKGKPRTSVATGANENDVAIVETAKQGTLHGGRSLSNANVPDRLFGIVYTRKRKKVVGDGPNKKMFRLQFSRRQHRRKDRCVLGVTVKRHLGVESGLFSRFLFLVLRHAGQTGLVLKKLSAFVMSEPFCGVYASKGIQFLQGSPIVGIGVCQFFGTARSMPSFRVDFSAVPLCFKYLHSTMILRSMFWSIILVCNPRNGLSDVEEEEEDIDFPELQIKLKTSRNSFKREPAEIGTVMPDVIEINDGFSLQPSIKGSRLPGRNGQYRNVKSFQRRRTSLHKRKARHPSLVDRNNGALASDLKIRQTRSMSAVASNKKLRSLANSRPAVGFIEARRAMVDSTEGLDSSLCSANILVIESDRCYRVEGAAVTLEMSASKEWHLAVKKDGLRRCTLKAEKVMRPCSSNRYTHVIMFSLDNGWKLEFPNRRDWSVFKDLYKECSDRTIPAPVAKFIPVPGVRDVSGYADSVIVPFNRPDTYISANGDELSRAMARKTANYDIDSEDEEWLSKFNAEFQERVSEDNFELIVDALEKAYYCNPDDCFDEKSVSNQCQDLGSNVVVEAVYSYWMRKRKQKRSSLLRVFQSHQSKRAPLIPKPLLRKRRSFKRQPSQSGRGKHPSVLQAIVAQQDAMQEKNAMLKVEQAKSNANESKEFAIAKRKRAQSLMENADLAIYKATMLLRIAEAAQAGESVNDLAGYFLD